MAILRAAFLADPLLPESGPTLLLTYNKALCNFIRSIGDGALKGVVVEHYHKFARGYLNHRGKMGWGVIAGRSRRLRLIETAIANVSARYNPNSFFDRPLKYFSAEIAWVAQHGITSLADYQSADRVGRADARMEAIYKPQLWEMVEEYRRLRGDAGLSYDFDDLATDMSEELDIDTDERKYKHIVIDEGQDLSPEMIRSIAKAVSPAGSVTFFGDVAQQIYGHRMSWRAAGLKPTKIWNFSENYRNTREIALLGLEIASMPYYAGASDMVAPTAPAAAGAKPTVVSFADATAEMPFVLAQARRLAQTQSVAILTRTARQTDDLQSAANGSAVDLRSDELNWSAGPGLYSGTYHSAKGLEFDAVILPFISTDLMPDPAFIADFGRSEAEANDGRLLYVGVTRAKTILIITQSGGVSQLLPANPSLYTALDR